MMKHLLAAALLVSAALTQERPAPPADIAEQVRSAMEAFDKSHRKFELALVELGPAAIPELERLSGKTQGLQKEALRASIEQIKRLREPIEKLVAELGEEKVETREKATVELRRMGRAARSYLEAALKSENAEVRARSKVLLVMISPRDRDQVRWAEIAEAHAKRVALLEPQVKSGTVSSADLLKAKRDLLKARHKAGEITLQVYLREAREIAERSANLAQVQFQNGTLSRKAWMAAKLELLYVDRRLGKAGDEEIQALQLQWMELARLDKSRGLLGEAELLREAVAFLTDPDEDLSE